MSFGPQNWRPHRFFVPTRVAPDVARPNFDKVVDAVNRVERLLVTTTAAFNAAGLPYAIVGGCATALWICTGDDAAERTTPDVDILVRRRDLERVDTAVSTIGMKLTDYCGNPTLIECNDSTGRPTTDLIFANERYSPDSTDRTPDVSPTVTLRNDIRVVPLIELLRMKLIAFRLIDRVHLEDIMKAGLITTELAAQLRQDLRAKLHAIREQVDWGFFAEATF